MFVPLLLLAAGAVLTWLSHFDRVSALALAVVEVESQIGFALWPPFLTVGAVLLIVRVWHARPRAAHPARPLTRDAARTRQRAPGIDDARGAALSGDAPPDEGGPTWLGTVRTSARAVTDDPMGRIRFDAAAGVPIALVLTGVTREQARRRVAAYAAWLATIPVPPTARVRVVSSPDLEAPLQGLLRGELARHFPADAFHVTSSHEGADAVFAWPDPRWSG
ncbi:MAG: hypothetical protein Q8P18_02150 [Pseudomonadota bacterium]|nr:hypothetical protein [Pseudomonadota bacterium]